MSGVVRAAAGKNLGMNVSIERAAARLGSRAWRERIYGSRGTVGIACCQTVRCRFRCDLGEIGRQQRSLADAGSTPLLIFRACLETAPRRFGAPPEANNRMHYACIPTRVASVRGPNASSLT